VRYAACVDACAAQRGKALRSVFIEKSAPAVARWSRQLVSRRRHVVLFLHLIACRALMAAQRAVLCAMRGAATRGAAAARISASDMRECGVRHIIVTLPMSP